MSIPISSMMHADVQVVGMDDSIAHIEHLMKQQQLSWVPVRDGDGPVLGVVSAADLVQFHAQQRDAVRCRLHPEKDRIDVFRKKKTGYEHAEQRPRHDEAHQLVRDPLPPHAVRPWRQCRPRQ